MPVRKNLLIFHLESIAWQTVNAFPEAFPNLNRLLPSSRVFRNYFSAATSTQMAVSYFFHANDFEMDAAPGLSRPAQNNPGLFALLGPAGYACEFLCVSSFQAGKMLPALADSTGPVWSTGDFAALTARFEEMTDKAPFAAYVWNLGTHLEHAMAFTSHARSADDLVGGACAVADHLLGALVGILERKGLLDRTTVLIHGDHGDDYWTHGFKKGHLHGTEPWTHLVHAPLVIRDPSLPAGNDNRVAGTVDLAPTLLQLLGVAADLPFPHSGKTLIGAPSREHAFSQNFTAAQPDSPGSDIRKCFAVHDRSYSLLVDSRGLKLFNHRLDPTNHCNLLHFFDMDAVGDIVLRPASGHAHAHFAITMRHLLGDRLTFARDFATLRDRLADHVEAKNAYAAARHSKPRNLLDMANLRRIDRTGFRTFVAQPRAQADSPVERQARSRPGALLDALLKRRRRGDRRQP